MTKIVSMINEIVSEAGSQNLSGNNLSYSFLLGSISFALGKHKEIAEGGSASVNAVVMKHLDGVGLSLKEILIEVAKVQTLNKMLARAMPLVAMRKFQEGTAVLGGLNGHGASNRRADENWKLGACAGDLFVTCRDLLTTATKKAFFGDILTATVTPTSPSHDEYDTPREIKVIKVNRISKSRSVVQQMCSEMKGWPSSAFRRCYIARGSGGQARFFKVKLIGEGADDHGGPLRVLFDDVVDELQGGREDINVFVRTGNNASGIGEGQNLWRIKAMRERPRHGAGSGETERLLMSEYLGIIKAPEDSKLLTFVGKLFGAAVRLKIPLRLNLGLKSFWNLLAKRGSSAFGKEEAESILKEVDLLSLKQPRDDGEGAALDEACSGTEAELRDLCGGISSVVPVEILPIFDGTELKAMFCGRSDVDVDLLKDCTVYEGFKEGDEVVTWFWELLREMTQDERVAFLRFTWARSSLPERKQDFDQPFKLIKNEKDDQDLDSFLATSSTCFFSLCIPEYSNKDVLRHKLLYAIKACPTLDADFVTSNQEIASGYGAL